MATILLFACCAPAAPHPRPPRTPPRPPSPAPPAPPSSDVRPAAAAPSSAADIANLAAVLTVQPVAVQLIDSMDDFAANRAPACVLNNSAHISFMRNNCAPESEPPAPQRERSLLPAAGARALLRMSHAAPPRTPRPATAPQSRT